MRLHKLIAASMLGLTSCVLGQATTRPFTIGPDTTGITGPLNEDGTINYVAAINTLLSKGITKENNAAVILLQATTTAGNRETYARLAAQLGVPVSADGPALQNLTEYVQSRQNLPMAREDLDASDKELQKSVAGPWRALDLPTVAAWLEHEQKALALLERACEMPRCYLPWVSRETPPSWHDAMPPMAPFRAAGQTFAARAMLRGGSGDFAGALDDLRRAQTLARFVAEQRSFIAALVAVAIDVYAERGYQNLATASNLTAAQLASMRQQIMKVPEVPSIGDCTEIEGLLSLDEAMACIRGDLERVVRGAAGDFDDNSKYDTGDLSKTDWDALLRNLRRESGEERRILALPFAARQSALDKATKAAIDNGIPGSSLINMPNRATGKSAIEAFLKKPAGESADQYAARMAQWWVAGSPDTVKRADMLMERGRLDRSMALLAISLAEYHISHGGYPEMLRALGEPVLQDPFSGRDIVYRCEGAGYVLYSVGLNQKDDGGDGDDRMLKAEK
jgi:hypothetical protein